MKKLLLYTLAILAISISAVSCSEDNGAYYPEPSEFSVSPVTGNFDAAGGTLQLTINGGNLGWWIVSSSSWCTVSKSYGSGNATITITVTANSTGIARNSVVTVNPTFQQQPVEVEITQN